MKFDYVRSVRDGRTQVCTYDHFLQMVRSEGTRQAIEAYRGGDAQAKRRLPAFCFHAHFGGKRRAVEHAQPSGLVMVDFDHLTPERLQELRTAVEALHRLPESGIMLAHVTPSGAGLRVVIKAQRNDLYGGCQSIADYQTRLATLLQAEAELDRVTTDLARLSFAPMMQDVFILESRLFSDAPEVTEFASSHGAAAARPATPQPIPQPSAQSDYKGVPLADIFARYFLLNGGLPNEGERNARYYEAARDLRYICDFNPHTLAAHLPDVGLPADEVLAVCVSACGSSRASRIPQSVQATLADFADAGSEEAAQAEAAAGLDFPLPVVFRPLVETCPPSFRGAALLALLPVVGTLATGVRGRYLDGELHSPSFISVVSAEQASGKSFMRRFVDLLMRDIAEEDAAARAVEMAYRKEMKKKRNAKDQPEPPREMVRIVPASVSVAKLLQRLDYAEGKHLFSFAEELDTVIKSNQSGAWSQKSDIYRNAFDNALYGQDYMNDDTYSAIVPVFYNLLFLGTPRQTSRFFKNVENGLVSRTCFAHLPDQFGAKMPRFGTLSEAVEARLKKHIAVLRSFAGEVSMDFLLPAMESWLEQQRLQALRENNRARDIFRRRAAVIGFRAAMTVAPCYTLSATTSRTMLRGFALGVANMVLENQLRFAEAELNSIIERGAENTLKSKELFHALPEVFTLSDLAAALRQRGMKTPARGMVYLWKREQMVEAGEEKKTFKKVKSEQNGTQSETN